MYIIYQIFQVGFNKGDDIHYYSVPGSMTPDIANLLQKSNVGQPGKFLFRVDLPEIDDDTANTECNFVKTDLVFLVDSSLSEESNFKKILNVIYFFISNVEVSKLRIGVASFSGEAKEEFVLNSYDNVNDMKGNLSSIKHMNGTTNMEIGLRLVR